MFSRAELIFTSFMLLSSQCRFTFVFGLSSNRSGDRCSLGSGRSDRFDLSVSLQLCGGFNAGLSSVSVSIKLELPHGLAMARFNLLSLPRKTFLSFSELVKSCSDPWSCSLTALSSFVHSSRRCVFDARSLRTFSKCSLIVRFSALTLSYSRLMIAQYRASCFTACSPSPYCARISADSLSLPARHKTVYSYTQNKPQVYVSMRVHVLGYIV